MPKQCEEIVILVDQYDNQIGIQEKLAAHEMGLLHRAFSVFIFNSQGQVLIHQRAHGKYHSPGLWSNTCCSHPRPGESIQQAALRRLQEEMGFVCEVTEVFAFIYKVTFDDPVQVQKDRENNRKTLCEHEFDHVFIGQYDGPVCPNTEEVADYAWVCPDDLLCDIIACPDKYTYWLKVCAQKVIDTTSISSKSDSYCK
ncbi:MAG: isopentenyl-diphosphate Delta-isomerase [bacterium]